MWNFRRKVWGTKRITERERERAIPTTLERERERERAPTVR
jgi:hypothetical protein